MSGAPGGASLVLRHHIDKDGTIWQAKIKTESIEWWSPALAEGQGARTTGCESDGFDFSSIDDGELC